MFDHERLLHIAYMNAYCIYKRLLHIAYMNAYCIYERLLQRGRKTVWMLVHNKPVTLADKQVRGDLHGA